MYLHPAVPDCVLLAVGGDHSAHKHRRPAHRQVPALHHDSRHLVHCRHRRRPQRPLQVRGEEEGG